jgi:F0F1-type ATP synthase assembly protein I
MAKKDSSERLEKLEKEKLRIEKELRAIRYQRKAEERKADSRRKLLIEVAVIEAVNDGKMTGQFLGEILDSYIVKERDREFLGLATKG